LSSITKYSVSGWPEKCHNINKYNLPENTMFLHPTTRSKLFIIDSAYVHYYLLAFIVWRCGGAHLNMGFMTEDFPYKFNIMNKLKYLFNLRMSYKHARLESLLKGRRWIGWNKRKSAIICIYTNKICTKLTLRHCVNFKWSVVMVCVVCTWNYL
jgi:hypothetical protein